MSFIQDSHKVLTTRARAHTRALFEILSSICDKFESNSLPAEKAPLDPNDNCSVVPCLGLSRRCCGVRPTPIHPLCLRTLRALLPFRVLRINELEMRPVSCRPPPRPPLLVVQIGETLGGLRNRRVVSMQSGRKGWVCSLALCAAAALHNVGRRTEGNSDSCPRGPSLRSADPI